MSGNDSETPLSTPRVDEVLSENHILALYIAGPSSLSRRAIVNTRRICEEFLHGRYELDVVDLCRHPELAASQQIVAAPTLVKKSPLPQRRFVGDMSKTQVIVDGLGIGDPADFDF